MRNEKCGTTVIGQHGRPRDRGYYAVYHTQLPGQPSGEMRNVDAESNFFYTVHVIVNC